MDAAEAAVGHDEHVIPGARFGLHRANQPLESLDTEPARTGSSLRDVLSFF